ncbi:MAG TPA: hypothetical protein VFE47_07975 [Tepidisphaeraceae bacterium]|jgi:hypothetical protein|nr:hypothetical protein [Tepidisphaeraceae bacterium]
MVRFFTVAIVLLLILVAGTGVLWATSYFVTNTTYQRGPRMMFLHIDEGDNYLFLRPGAIEMAIISSLPDHAWGSEGIYPFWKVELCLLLPCGVCFGLRRIAKGDAYSMVPGVCRVCGYDLRATAGRCPECGASNDKS